MTRKDYILIAEALQVAKNAMKTVDTLFGANQTVEYIANALQADNPRFDRAHFLAVVRGERELTSRPKRKQSALEQHMEKFDVPQD